MTIVINCDGACEPVNPGGIASYGFVIRNSKGEILKKEQAVVGTGEDMTNNVAEYTAAIGAIEWVADNLDPSKVVLQGDSQLIIRQISGSYAVKSSRLRPLYEEFKETIDDLSASFEAKWVPREQNEEADTLSKKVIREYIRTHDYTFNGYPIIECDECGAWMVVREGEFGKFYGCSRYPKCKNTKSLENQE